MAKKKKAASPFLGQWPIISLDEWGEGDDDADAQSFVRFDDRGTGCFQIGYLYGDIDWRPETHGGETLVAWSWEGGDEGDGSPSTGRGWAKLQGDALVGKICIHLGDESGFVASRMKPGKNRAAGKRRS